MDSLLTMGLGPRGSSLLERTGIPAVVWRDPFAMQLEQQDRGEQRRLKAIWHATRHAPPKKPIAPVESSGKVKGGPRVWVWVGESIESKGMLKGNGYTGERIRKAGFKLPKIGGGAS